ncbi:MAG: hypothetical protein KF803_02715 [Cyclobacteriaceae bacterium]|nr:hypothetical protein [Cyclobacteriaceae bacterium]
MDLFLILTYFYPVVQRTKKMTRIFIGEGIVFLYIVLLVYAAVTKLLDHEKFVVQVGQSPILTDYAVFLAWAVPLVELVISALLIVPGTRLVGLYAGFSLLVMFTTYIVLASRFSDFVPCSCGGVLEGMTWTQHLFFNVAFVLMGIIGILLYPKLRTMYSTPDHV